MCCRLICHVTAAAFTVLRCSKCCSRGNLLLIVSPVLNLHNKRKDTERNLLHHIYYVLLFLFFLPLQEDVSCHASKDSRSGPSSAVLHRHGHRARGQQEIQVPAVNVTLLTSTGQWRPDQRFLFERSCRKQTLNFIVFAHFISHFIPLANAQMHPGVSLPNETKMTLYLGFQWGGLTSPDDLHAASDASRP